MDLIEQRQIKYERNFQENLWQIIMLTMANFRKENSAQTAQIKATAKQSAIKKIIHYLKSPI